MYSVRTYLRNIKLSALILLSVAFGVTKKYDKYFIAYSHIYFPYLNWRWFKAQAIAESSLNPKAKSRAGAIGLMQIMPSTARWLGVDPSKLYIPCIAIATGVRYDKWLEKFWRRKSSIEYLSLLDFIFASYNAGPGRVYKSYRRTKSKYIYDLSLPRETINYVTKIKYYYYLKLR